VVQRVTAAGNEPEILEKSWRSTPALGAYINNLFVPAFAGSLKPEQVELQPARDAFMREPAVELWRLEGGNKSERAQALASAIAGMMAGGRTIVDKDSKQERAATYSDIAIMCRTHVNLDEIAGALSEAKLPIRYKRPGLLATPEGCLAMACLRRLIDPQDTLPGEISQNCENPRHGSRQYLNDADNSPTVAGRGRAGPVLDQSNAVACTF
jgi:ATP-dependent exoDNAse (exonuclease V) beta subunit